MAYSPLERSQFLENLKVMRKEGEEGDQPKSFENSGVIKNLFMDKRVSFDIPGKKR
jgi:hypothetical protein